MKIVKYILIAGILLIIYITEPIWRVQSTYTSTDDFPIEKRMQAQQDKRDALNAEEGKKLRELEKKFGKKPEVKYKSKVPKPLERYWNSKLLEGESICDDICTPLHPTNNGWATSCQYKVRSKDGTLKLKLDTYTIRDGKIIK